MGLHFFRWLTMLQDKESKWPITRVISKSFNSFVSQRNQKTKKGFDIYIQRAFKWDQIQLSCSSRLEMACDQRIRKCTNLTKHRSSSDLTKEVIFLKIGYADYFFDFRIGFPTSKTAENYRNIFGTMKTKLAVPERTCARGRRSRQPIKADYQNRRSR